MARRREIARRADVQLYAGTPHSLGWRMPRAAGASGWWWLALLGVGGFGAWYLWGKGRQTVNALVSSSQPQLVDLVALRKVMPNLPMAKAEAYLPWINDALSKCGIVTPLGAAVFLAEIAEESNQLTMLVEGWNPGTGPGQVPDQLYYETARPRLGNTQPGDGFKYRGRGPIQLTGRGAYAACNDALRALGYQGDIVANPELLATDPAAMFGSAAWFWVTNHLTPYAEAGQFLAVSNGINRGNVRSTALPNGWELRQKYFAAARAALNA